MIQKTNNEKKIDLCIILSHFPQGGAERQTLYLIQGLLLKEYKVTLILYDANEVFYDEINQLPINIIKKNGRKKNKFLKYIENIFFIRNEIKRQKYDIIHTLLFHNGLWVRIAAWGIYKNRIVYSVRNSVEDYPKVYLFFEKVFIRYSFIVTNSKKSLNQFSKIFKTKYQNRLTNIYNGFEIERFTSQKQVFHNDQIIIGTVGRQTLQKNQIQILRVINIIKNTYKIRFSLIGDKTQNESKRISDYIALNNLSEYVQVLDAQKEIERYYKKFQIFILSSFYEGCPNVLFEAMLSKC